MPKFAPQNSRLSRTLTEYQAERNRRVDNITTTAALEDEEMTPKGIVGALPDIPLLDITYAALMLEHTRSGFGEHMIASRGLVIYGLARTLGRSAFSMRMYDLEGDSAKIDLNSSIKEVHDILGYAEQNPDNYLSSFIKQNKRQRDRMAEYFIAQASALSPLRHFDPSARGQIIGRETIGLTAEGMAAYELESITSGVESGLAVNDGIVRFNFLASAQRAGLEIRYRDDATGDEETIPDIYLPRQPFLP